MSGYIEAQCSRGLPHIPTTKNKYFYEDVQRRQIQKNIYSFDRKKVHFLRV